MGDSLWPPLGGLGGLVARVPGFKCGVDNVILHRWGLGAFYPTIPFFLSIFYWESINTENYPPNVCLFELVVENIF